MSITSEMIFKNALGVLELQDHMFHAFAIFPICKEGKEAYKDVLKNLK